MRTSLLGVWLFSAAVVILLLWPVPTTAATIVLSFRDLTDTVSFAENGEVNGPGNSVGLNGTEIIFTHRFFTTPTAVKPGLYGLLLTERDSQTPSDFLVMEEGFTVGGVQFGLFDFVFFSDPDLQSIDESLPFSPPGSGSALFSSLQQKGLGVRETQDPLNVTNLFRDTNGNPILVPRIEPAGDQFVIEIQSDVEVPLPATVWLLGGGIAFLLGVRQFTRHSL